MSGHAGSGDPWLSMTAVRESKGITKAVLARRAGMHPSHVTALEYGYVHPRIDTVHRVAEALGVPASAVAPPPKRDRRRALTEERVREIVREVVREELAKAIAPDQD